MGTQARPDLCHPNRGDLNPNPITTKRKRPAQHKQDDDPPAKRVNHGPTPTQHAAELVRETHSSILDRMSSKYHTEMLSVISSAAIRSKVDSVLHHLSQFHPTDMSVLPGVVLLHSRVKCAQKLFTIIEITKRRIHEMDQRWYQYNQLHQVQVDVRPEELSRIEETVLVDGNGEDNDEDSEDDAFEPLPVPVQQQVGSTGTRPQLFLSVFLTRVPIPEFHGKGEYTMQTNTGQLEIERASRMGNPGVRRGGQQL